MSGLFSRLFTPRKPDSRLSQGVTADLYDGQETLEVVGESFYQGALWKMVGGLRAEPVRFDAQAVLVPEPNAIQVRIGGALVGYLSRHDAAALSGLQRLMDTGASHLVALHAQIVGGGPRDDGLGFLGVFLDHDPADFGLARHHVSRGHMRTGLTAALETDLADGTYDLSWQQTLSSNDSMAARELETLLEAEDAPIALRT